jgi:hypothetical protein
MINVKNCLEVSSACLGSFCWCEPDWPLKRTISTQRDDAKSTKIAFKPPLKEAITAGLEHVHQLTPVSRWS